MSEKFHLENSNKITYNDYRGAKNSTIKICEGIMDKNNNQQDTGKENGKQDKIYWHDAFFAALQLELHD